MGIKTFNPYTPSRRAMTQLDNDRDYKVYTREVFNSISQQNSWS